MKVKIQKVVLSVIVAVAAIMCNFASYGQVGASAPEQLAVGSVDDLQAFAWEQVANGSMSAWSSSAINATPNNRSQVSFKYKKTNGFVDVEEVLDLIKAQRLTMDVLHLTDYIQMGVYLYNGSGDYLFSGYTYANINPPTNGVSRNPLGVVLELADNFWIPFDDAVSYHFVERDSNGNVIRVYYAQEWDIRDGRIRYYGYFASKNGELVITRSDGTEVAYNLRGGKRMEPKRVEENAATVSVLGMRTFRNTNVVYLEITEEESYRNINPTVQLVNPLTNVVYLAAWRVDQKTGEIEYASSVKYWRGPSSRNATPVPIPAGVRYVPVVIGGNQWIKFRFPSGYGETKNQFNPPYVYYGGGKG